MDIQDYERRHIDFVRQNASEGTLFLKRNDAFPLKEPCPIVLVGNGARKTIKGGTGSGDVAARFFRTCEQGLEEAGFSITSKAWLDQYDAYRAKTKKDYIRETKKAARKAHILSAVFSMGYFEEEKEYPFEPTCEGEAAIYVLARNSGEGNDRRAIKGDVYLTEREIKDILALNARFERFLLVLNVGGPVDLSPVLAVSNILYLSQLGAVTGDVLADIVLGKSNPSGKLTTTWAKPVDYPCFHEFGDRDDTNYKEGIYVGYRYFDSKSIEPLFPFGYGLSYSRFRVTPGSVSVQGTVIHARASVQNISGKSGKEVVQAYLSCPSGTLIKEYQSLAGFQKTRLLSKDESEEITISFDLRDFASYDEETASFLLEKGEYIVRLGTSSRDNVPCAKLILSENVTVKRLKNECGVPGFEDMALPFNKEELGGLPSIQLDSKAFKTETVSYEREPVIDPSLSDCSDEELALLTMGHHKTGFAAIVGSSCEHVVGGAGETALCVHAVPQSLTMADGPAGLRLRAVYGTDQKGVYDLALDPMMEKMLDFLPRLSRPFIVPKKNRHGTIHTQYTTAIPIGTSLAMSFNQDYLRGIGDLVGEEMEIYGVDLWLAPALNIHRNILCGRNFEYYSEDPLVAGFTASWITKGVQSHPGKGVTLKHFACNNQEFNRNNSNSHVSERALREIYLRGFERCMKEARPLALMTSYNLINGTHASESKDLLLDIVRAEWGYEGLIMTDWIASGRSFCPRSNYPAPYASNNILAGNDLTMSGCPADEKDVKKALRSGKLTRKDLLISASAVVKAIRLQKGE